MLRLLSLLQTHRYWPGPELAARLEVSERTLRRDVERLRGLGYDVDAIRGVSGGYQLRAGKALPPLLLDNDEAVAIAAGLRSSAAMVVDGGGDAAISALTKVIAMLPPALRRRMDALQTATTPGLARGVPVIDAEALTTLAGACRDREGARFTYRPLDGEASERRVEPHALVSFEQRWYVVAYDLGRDDWRTFRVDRMAEVRAGGARFVPREIPGGSALAHVQEGRQSQARRYAVEVRFHTSLEVVRGATNGWGDVTADGTVAVWRIAADSLDWPLMLLAQIDADFEVVSPPELAELAAATGVRLSRCTARTETVRAQ